MKTLLIRCSCFHHVMTIDYDEEDNTLDISILPAHLSFWEKIKYLFLNATPITAGVILFSDDIKQLKDFFISLAPKQSEKFSQKVSPVVIDRKLFKKIQEDFE